MKKTLIALSFVCAGALAFADKAQYNSSWFSGIGAEATSIEALGASNGTWSNLTADNASVADGALELDLEDAEEATFTVDESAKSAAQAEFPVQSIVVRGVFTPIAADDLLTGKAMATKGAKVGFAIVNVGGETDSYKYYAWVGGGSEAETESTSAISDWVALGDADATKVAAAQTVVIGLDYSKADAVTATFAVGDDEATANVLKSESLAGAAREKAKTDKVIASVSCTGSGTLSVLQGKYQYAVAEVDGVKYATVEAAVAEAATSKNGTVTVVRNLQDGDTVAAANGVTLKTGDGVTLPVDKVTTSDSSKEVKVVDGVVTVRTTKGILNAIEVGTAKKTNLAEKNEEKFRDFLNRHCGTAYRKANTEAADIQKALAVVDSTSKRTLWQSYALGVEPDATLKLTRAESDTDTPEITLKFPGTPSGDFTISYTVTDGTEAGTKTATLVDNAPAVTVPLKTGKYSVSFSFE